MSDRDPHLEQLRAAHRATARYSIYRHRLADDKYHRVRETLDDKDLTWDQVSALCEAMNREAREAAGSPTDTWGLTQYYPKLETPSPPRWTAPRPDEPTLKIMIPIQVPTSQEDLVTLAAAHDNAQFLVAQSDDPEEVRLADARIVEIQAAFEAAPCTLDEDGNFVLKEAPEAVRPG